jgi:hypothetical protein
LPRPTDPWLAFVALLRECGRFDARDLLQAIEGPTFAVASIAGDGAGTAERMLYLHELRQVVLGEDALG